jgi:hypothetical protein
MVTSDARFRGPIKTFTASNLNLVSAFPYLNDSTDNTSLILV